jgi:hypothetical protein
MQLAVGTHQQALLQDARCGWCAERVAYRLLIGNGTCPHCEGELQFGAGNGAMQVVERTQAQWRRWRWPIYGSLGFTSIFASLLPFLSALLFVLTGLVVQFAFVRRITRWLGPFRRVSTRMTLKLFFAGLMMTNIVISTLMYPLFGVAQIVSVLLNVFFAFIYFEVSIKFANNRLRREGESASLDTWEWALPAGIIGSLVVVTFAMVLGTMALLHVLLEMELPGVSSIAKFLLDRGGN